MKLTSENVEATFAACLRNEGAVTDGVAMRAYLDVSGHEANIVAMLSDLPEPFHADKGGGWTFLNACYDKAGEQWTGFHQMVDKLVMLGRALGVVKWCLPREHWNAFPGGMPYFMVTKGAAHERVH